MTYFGLVKLTEGRYIFLRQPVKSKRVCYCGHETSMGHSPICPAIQADGQRCGLRMETVVA